MERLNKFLYATAISWWAAAVYAQSQKPDDLGARLSDLTISTILSIVGLLATGAIIRFILDLRKTDPNEQFSCTPQYLLPTAVVSIGGGMVVLLAIEYYISRGTLLEPHNVPVMLEGFLTILGSINNVVIFGTVKKVYDVIESKILDFVGRFFGGGRNGN